MRNWVLRTRQRPGFSNWVHKVGKYDAPVTQVPLAFFFNRLVSREQAWGNLQQRPAGLHSVEWRCFIEV